MKSTHCKSIISLLLITNLLFIDCYVQTPSTRIKIPKRIHDVSYKGSIFSYHSSNGSIKDLFKTNIRDYALETDEIKFLEEKFIDYFSEIILTKFANEMKSGIPSMSIPKLDPLRLNEIKIEPQIGNEIFTINLNNIEIDGLSDFDLQDLRPKLNILKVRLALIFPKLIAKCNFNVNGTIYNLINVNGEGLAKLEYTDVLVRTQINLLHENNTIKILNCDPPLVDFNTAKIILTNEDYTNNNNDNDNDNNNNENQNKTSSSSTTKIGMASELGPLLFWVFADHVVQEIDQYLLKYINNNMFLFKVPETFNPAITWFLNRNNPLSPSLSSSSNHFYHHSNPFLIPNHHHHHNNQQLPPILNPFPLLNHWINSLSSLKPLSTSSSGTRTSNGNNNNNSNNNNDVNTKFFLKRRK